MDSETKVIDLQALSNFKTLQDSYNEEKFMTKEEFLNESGLIKSEVLSIAIENQLATYKDIYELFYAETLEDDTTSA